MHKIDKLIGHDQLESNIWMIGKKPFAEPRQDFGPDIVWCGDANKAGDTLVFGAGFADGIGQIVEGFSAALKKAASCIGQLKLSRRPIDQRNSDLSFKGSDGATHPRLWLFEHLRRFGEAAQLAESNENGNPIEIDFHGDGAFR